MKSRFSSPEKIAFLKKVALFSRLSKRHLKEIAKLADEVPMKAEAVLAKEGKIGLEFFFIVEGKVRVEKDGRVINQMSTNDFFGEISLLDKKPRTATVKAETDGTLLVVHARSFDKLLEKTPGLLDEIVIALCEYLRRAENITKRH